MYKKILWKSLSFYGFSNYEVGSNGFTEMPKLNKF